MLIVKTNAFNILNIPLLLASYTMLSIMEKLLIFRWPFTNIKILSNLLGSFGMILEVGDCLMMISLKIQVSILFQRELILLKKLEIETG